MAEAAKAQEPSMEEILASIRRIIADDDSKPAARAEAPKPVPIAPRPVPSPVASSPAVRQPKAEPAVPVSEEREPSPAEPSAQPEVLDLTEAMASGDPVSNQPEFKTIDGQPDIVFADPPPPVVTPEAPPSMMPQSTSFAPADEGYDRLLSRPASMAVDSAFNSLAQTVLVHNARTLEDLVREMLRPLLKSWLDDNLPGLVERLVRAEIERVSRGRG